MAEQEAAGLSIELPYSPYRVQTTYWWNRVRIDAVVDLRKNSQLRTGKEHQQALRAAKRQMARDVDGLMLAEYWPEMRTPLVLSATVYTVTQRRRDDDGAVIGIYPARDAMAAHLGIDDHDIQMGPVMFEQGEPERTVLRLETGGRS